MSDLHAPLFFLTTTSFTTPQTFDPYVIPLLAKDMDLSRFEEFSE